MRGEGSIIKTESVNLNGIEGHKCEAENLAITDLHRRVEDGHIYIFDTQSIGLYFKS